MAAATAPQTAKLMVVVDAAPVAAGLLDCAGEAPEEPEPEPDDDLGVVEEPAEPAEAVELPGE